MRCRPPAPRRPPRCTATGRHAPATSWARTSRPTRTVTAVFAANDQMAIGVLRAFAEAGRDVPGDVSVVGFDDVPEAAYLLRALTTVRQDLGHLATFGVEMLVDAIENPRRQDRRENVPVELVVRETTAAPPAGR